MGEVAPQSHVRYSANLPSPRLLDEKMTFAVVSVTTGETVWGSLLPDGGTEIRAGSLMGNAYIDAEAPAVPGTYKLIVRQEDAGWTLFNPFDKGHHDQTQLFRVAIDAPEPPTTPGHPIVPGVPGLPNINLPRLPDPRSLIGPAIIVGAIGLWAVNQKRKSK